MASNEDLSRTYDDAMKAFEHAVIIGATPTAGIAPNELIGRQLAMATAQCKIMAGIYVELVQARNDRRRQG